MNNQSPIQPAMPDNQNIDLGKLSDHLIFRSDTMKLVFMDFVRNFLKQQPDDKQNIGAFMERYAISFDESITSEDEQRKNLTAQFVHDFSGFIVRTLKSGVLVSDGKSHTMALIDIPCKGETLTIAFAHGNDIEVMNGLHDFANVSLNLIQDFNSGNSKYKRTNGLLIIPKLPNTHSRLVKDAVLLVKETFKLFGQIRDNNVRSTSHILFTENDQNDPTGLLANAMRHAGITYSWGSTLEMSDILELFKDPKTRKKQKVDAES